jgi:hypothetical protein
LATKTYSYADRAGSVSNVLRTHRAEIRAVADFDKAKSLTLKLLNSEAKTDGTTASKYISWIKNNIHNLTHLHNYIDAVIRRGEAYQIPSTKTYRKK